MSRYRARLLLAYAASLLVLCACADGPTRAVAGPVARAGASSSRSDTEYEWPDERVAGIDILLAGVKTWNADPQTRVSGVELMVVPKDRYGHTIKRAGIIEIGVYEPDLLIETLPKREIFQWEPFEPMEANALWVDLTFSGYRLRCEWPQGALPDIGRAVIKVVFTTRDGESVEASAPIDIAR